MGYKKQENKEMPFLEHLEELRQRLFRMLGAFILVSLICYSFSGFFVNIILAPAKGAISTLVFLKLPEAFMVHIKVSLIAGFIVASPYIFYQLWLFIMPGLYAHEKKVIIPLLIISIILFICGICFAYFGVIRFGIAFLMGYETEQLKGTISIESYISLVTTLFFTFGIVFELPLVLLALNQIGIISVETLKDKRPIAIVLIFVVAAIITPPDVITQILLAIPLVFLYEISIWSAVILNFLRRKKKKAESQEIKPELPPNPSESKKMIGTQPSESNPIERSTTKRLPPETGEIN